MLANTLEHIYAPHKKNHFMFCDYMITFMHPKCKLYIFRSTEEQYKKIFIMVLWHFCNDGYNVIVRWHNSHIKVTDSWTLVLLIFTSQ